MKIRTQGLSPALMSGGVIALVCVCYLALQLPALSGFDLPSRLEWMTYDWRVRVAAKSAPPPSPKLAAVFLDEFTVGILQDDTLGYKASWPYPMHVHGRVVRELAQQQAKIVAFDVLFGQLRPYEYFLAESNASVASSDEFFANQLFRSSNVVLAATGGDMGEVFPPPIFETNALSTADISANHDADGVLRRVRPYVDYPGRGRVWHMGVVLGAHALGLDLSKATVLRDEIILQSPDGVQRTIPLEGDGTFLIDWSIHWNDPRMTSLSFAGVLSLDELRRIGGKEDVLAYLQGLRESGKTNLIGNAPFRGKAVVIGSVMRGNNLSDLGATPLSDQSYLVSKHWNVANSIILGRFINKSSSYQEVCLIIVLGLLSSFLTWKMRSLWASVWILLLAAVYVGWSVFLFTEHRYSVPLIFPVLGGLVFTNGTLTSYRLVFEQRERRRIRNVFSKIVSPSVVNELLGAKQLALGGALRKITVYFSDVRGFTEMTDQGHERAEAYVRQHQLTGMAAEEYLDQQASEQLATVNLYLGTVADVVRKHDGTLDKYIGDCVMAFWGAPVPNDQHAVEAVRSAIEAQRAIYRLNQERASENRRREHENAKANEVNGEPQIMLPLLSLGTGINTGVVTVGLMGSDSNILNYTVFGRDVNLASRLESVSGRGRIIIGEATYAELHNLDPELASTCVELPPVTVKGFREEVRIFEVPWKIPVVQAEKADLHRPESPSKPER